MTDDLVKRLRDEGNIHFSEVDLCREAADRLERMEEALRDCVSHTGMRFSPRKDILKLALEEINERARSALKQEGGVAVEGQKKD